MSTPVYIQSSNVNVFPSTRRTYAQDFSARLMTESSIARIINSFINSDGFVISDSVSDTSFEFNINGYYFQLKNFLTFLNNSFSSSSNVYATIFIDPTNAAFTELYSVDSSSSFQGLAFSNDGNPTSPGSGYISKTLLISKKVESSWAVPEESKIKFTPSSVGLTVVDGGVI